MDWGERQQQREQQNMENLRRLMAEAQAMKTQPPPSGLSLIAGHPGLLAYESDSPGEWEEDQRQKYILDRLREAEDRDPQALLGLPAKVTSDVLAYRQGKLTDLDSPYHYRGWFTTGAPIRNVLHSLSAYPSAAYAASAMLANAVDPQAPFDRDAKSKWDSALETITAHKASDLGLVPKDPPTFASIANEARANRGRMGGTLPHARREWNDLVAYDADQRADDTMIDGAGHYERLGVNPTAARFLGAASDSVLDPYNGLGGFVRMAKQGKNARALWELGKEFGVGQGMAAAPSVMTLPGVQDFLRATSQ